MDPAARGLPQATAANRASAAPPPAPPTTNPTATAPPAWAKAVVWLKSILPNALATRIDAFFKSNPSYGAALARYEAGSAGSAASSLNKADGSHVSQLEPTSDESTLALRRIVTEARGNPALMQPDLVPHKTSSTTLPAKLTLGNIGAQITALKETNLISGENGFKAILNAADKAQTTDTDREAVSYTTALLDENDSANRYRNVLPCERTLVTQGIPSPGPNGKVPYVNASRVKGDIATQGPLSNTTAAFFGMAFNPANRAKGIACFTNYMEGEYNTVKCEPYWAKATNKSPFPLQPLEVPPDPVTLADGSQVVRNGGPVDIKNSKKETIGQMYTFERQDKDGNSFDPPEIIPMFHYTGWPDHGVPEKASDIVAFLDFVDKNSIGEGPLVNHCSAGIGRTGTFMIIRDLMHSIQQQVAEGKQPSEIEVRQIKDLLIEIRSDRQGMVQNAEQLEFIYTTLQSLLVMAQDGTLPDADASLASAAPTRRSTTTASATASSTAQAATPSTLTEAREMQPIPPPRFSSARRSADRPAPPLAPRITPAGVFQEVTIDGKSTRVYSQLPKAFPVSPSALQTATSIPIARESDTSVYEIQLGQLKFVINQELLDKLTSQNAAVDALKSILDPEKPKEGSYAIASQQRVGQITIGSEISMLAGHKMTGTDHYEYEPGKGWQWSDNGILSGEVMSQEKMEQHITETLFPPPPPPLPEDYSTHNAEAIPPPPPPEDYDNDYYTQQ